MDSLIIKKQYLDLILQNKKTWEIRGSITKKRGTIGLIESGSKTIVGECEIINCLKLTKEDFLQNPEKHQALDIEKTIGHYKQSYAWVVTNPIRYKEPKKYDHPKGAIIWVKT